MAHALCRHPVKISIHALREEGDAFTACMVDNTAIFLSTPSARRATLQSFRQIK